MQSFLNKFVEYYISQYDTASEQSLVVLPSKRAVAALKNCFAVQQKALWLPEIVDIISFIENLSGLKIISHQDALFALHHVNNQTKKDPEAFESFYSWGSVMLSDFNEIDRFLVDTTQFFEHHKALKELYYFGENKTKLIKSYIAFWERLPLVYNRFTEHLLQNDQAYQGLAYREAFKNIETAEFNQNIIFLGFNALNKAEEKIFDTLLKNDKAKIAWDINKEYLDEKHHPANNFIRKYIDKWQAYKRNIIDLQTPLNSKKYIEIIPTPKNIGQSKAVGNILKNIKDIDIQNTAIVINDESLINPILNSIPEHIENVNVTMGVPLSTSSFASFFKNVILHQKTQKKEIKYKFLRSLLHSEILSEISKIEKQKVLDYFEKNKLTSIDFQKLKEIKTEQIKLQKLLSCLEIEENPRTFIQKIINFIEELIASPEDPSPFLLSYQYVFSELNTILEREKSLSITAVFLLFKDMQKEQKLSFKGSKTTGLQVMGMLETRLLDFKNIILTSVNEGILPSGKSDNSFITYSLKKDYGLPTHKEKDAVYAYHFFRLLQRAENCFLIYDNDQTGFNKGDKSRFVTYLEIFKSKHYHIKTKPFILNTNLLRKPLIKIDKTPQIMDVLKNHANEGFSPTALTTYISNPVSFYKKYVLGVKETNLLEDIIDAREYGNVIHKTIEKLYKTTLDITPEVLEQFQNKIEDLVKVEFEKNFAKNEYLTGQNRLLFETAKSSLHQFISIEKQKANKQNFQIIAVEQNVQTTLSNFLYPVKLKGQIDRIDKLDGKLRIVDLKTGFVDSKQLQFDDFEEIITDEEKSKVFQTLFYAYIYSKNHIINDMEAGIISFKNLKNWFLQVKHGRNTAIDTEFLNKFENVLLRLINEILDPNLPFIEKESIFE